MKMSSVKREFCRTLNSYGVDNDLQTPDYMLAEYLIGCLESYAKCVGDKKVREDLCTQETKSVPEPPVGFNSGLSSASKFNR